jgi:ABC-type cobalt transport system substrate-binding protein
MNMILSLLFPVLKSIGTGVHFDLVGPNGERGVRVSRGFPVELVLIIIAGVVIIVLIVLAVKFLIRLKNKKTNHD